MIEEITSFTPKNVSLTSPVPPKQRHHIIDIIRGFALFGVLLSNMIWTSQHFALTHDDRAAIATFEIDRVFTALSVGLVDYKFYTLFSMLFGLGFAIQLSRASGKSQNVLPTYLRRLGFLLLFGIIHALCLWFGDVLHHYALLGFILILFRNVSNKSLLNWTIGIAVFTALLPAAQVVLAPEHLDTTKNLNEEAIRYHMLTGNNWAEYIRINIQVQLDYYNGPLLEDDGQFAWFLSIFWKFLLGFYIGRNLLLQNHEKYLPFYRRLFLPALVSGLVVASVLALGLISGVYLPEVTWAKLSWIVFEIGILSLSLAYLSGLVLLFQRSKWKKILLWLAPVGRMALTNYCSHSLVFIFLFYGIGLDLLGKVGSTFCWIASVLIFGIQIILSRWWLKQFRFGPLEWIWRSLTYGKLQAMSRGQENS